MKLISKLTYQARINGLDVVKGSDVVIKNITTGRHIQISPNGEIYSEDVLGHDASLKELMPQKFLVKDPLLFSGSFISLPCEVSLHVGRETSQRDVNFARGCLMQSFANIKKLNVVEDDDLLQHECRITQEFVLSYKERQAFIKACLEYLK